MQLSKGLLIFSLKPLNTVLRLLKITPMWADDKALSRAEKNQLRQYLEKKRKGHVCRGSEGTGQTLVVWAAGVMK